MSFDKRGFDKRDFDEHVRKSDSEGPKVNWTLRAVLILIGLAVVFSLLTNDEPESPTVNNPAPSSPAPSSASFEIPEVFQNIDGWVSTETDCTNLQSWFNVADNAHGNQSQLDAMQWLSALMGRIDSRMESVGCYG